MHAENPLHPLLCILAFAQSQDAMPESHSIDEDTYRNSARRNEQTMVRTHTAG